MSDFVPGVYRHYKGGLYTALGVVFNSTNSADRDEMVHYISHTTGLPCVRNRSEWEESVNTPYGIPCRRFVLVAEHQRPTKVVQPC